MSAVNCRKRIPALVMFTMNAALVVSSAMPSFAVQEEDAVPGLSVSVEQVVSVPDIVRHRDHIPIVLQVQLRFVNDSDRAIDVEPEDWVVALDDDAEEDRQIEAGGPPLFGRSRIEVLNHRYTLQPHSETDLVLRYRSLRLEQLQDGARLVGSLDGSQQAWEISEEASRILAMKIERIGPGDCLAVISLKGHISSLQMLTIRREMLKLHDEGIRRIILHLDDPDAVVSQTVQSWLAQTGGRRPVITGTPALLPPGSLELFELHTVGFSKTRGSSPTAFGSFSSKAVTRTNVRFEQHSTLASAISSALQSVYRFVDPKQVAADIQSTDPAIRNAAIEHGADRLPVSLQPVLLQMADQGTEETRLAAIAAMARIPSQQCIETLERQSRNASPKIATAALQSLMKNGLPYADDAVRNVWESNEPDDPRPGILLRQMLASEETRWDRFLVEFLEAQIQIEGRRHDAASETNTAMQRFSGTKTTERIGLAIQCVKQLAVRNDPELPSVAERLLVVARDKNLQNELVDVLVDSRHPMSIRVAEDFVRQELREHRVSGNGLDLIQQSPSVDWLPDLYAIMALRKSESDRRYDWLDVVRAIVACTDSESAHRLLELYPQLANPEKEHAILHLRHLDQPEWIALAVDAVISSRRDNDSVIRDSALSEAAISMLFEDGSPAAVDAMIQLLHRELETINSEGNATEPRKRVIQRLATKLVQLTHPECQRVVNQVLRMSERGVREPIRSTQRNRMLRSPVQDAYKDAMRKFGEQDYAEAEKTLESAVVRDPYNAELWYTLGVVRLRQDKLAEALSALRKADEWCPEHPRYQAAVGLALVRQSRIDEGLELADQAVYGMRYDSEVVLETAAVQVRAAEMLTRDPGASAATRKRAARLLDTAMELLSLTADSRYLQPGHLEDRADFQGLREHPDFDSLLERTRSAGPSPTSNQPRLDR